MAVGDDYECVLTILWASDQHTDTATASASYTDGGGNTVNPSDSDDANYFGATATITIDKVGLLNNAVVAPNSRTDAGDKINYTFTVTNTGNVTLTNVTITDPMFPALSCTFASLAPDVSDSSCTATVTLTQTQVDSGSVSNTAGVSGSFTDDAGNTATPTSTDTETVTITRNPSSTIDKVGLLNNAVVAPNSRTDAGDKINYTFTVTNTGNVTLTNVTITDPMFPALSCTFASLAPDVSDSSCTATVTLTQTQVDSGSVSNTAGVSGSFTDDAGNTATPTSTDTETVTITRNPSSTIDKVGLLNNAVVAPNSRTDAGDKINYTFTVTNTGNVTLTNVTITDPMFPALSCTFASLAPGVSDSTCIATVTLTQTQVDSGSVSNTATVSGTPPTGATPNPTTNTDTETVTITRSPSLQLTKTATPTTYSTVGQIISYSFELTNTGNVTLSAPFAVQDDQTSNESCPPSPTTIAPGASIICTATRTVTQADLDAGKIVNKATATATFNSATVTSNEATATVTVNVASTSTMTDSSFQLKDDLSPWRITDFEILLNGQSSIVATNPGQFYYHQRATSPYSPSVITQWQFNVNWAKEFTAQTEGGQPIHAYVQYATDPANTWRDWTPQSTGICWTYSSPTNNPANVKQCGTPSGTQYGTITVNNVPGGAKVWITVHLDYALKGTTPVPPSSVTTPRTYGPFSSDIVIKNQSGTLVLGASHSDTELLGRGKKVTVVYGTARYANGTAIADAWVKISQSGNTALAKTGTDGQYIFFDGQGCTIGDGLDGGCTGASTTQWNFSSGTQSATISIMGQGASATATPTWPSGTWVPASTVKVVSGATTFATVTYGALPNPPTYSVSVTKNSAYNRDWKFTP